MGLLARVLLGSSQDRHRNPWGLSLGVSIPSLALGRPLAGNRMDIVRLTTSWEGNAAGLARQGLEDAQHWKAGQQVLRLDASGQVKQRCRLFATLRASQEMAISSSGATGQ